MKNNYAFEINIEDFDNGMSFKVDYNHEDIEDTHLVFEEDDDFEKKIGHIFLQIIKDFMDSHLTSDIKLKIEMVDNNDK